MGFCNCSMFCCTLLYVPSSFAIILMGKRELITLLSMSSWCLVIVVWLFLAVPWVFLQFVIVVFLIILTYYFKFSTFLQNFISIFIIKKSEQSLSCLLREIVYWNPVEQFHIHIPEFQNNPRPVVTENSPVQNFGQKEDEKKRRREKETEQKQ